MVNMFTLHKSNGVVAMDYEGTIRVYDLKHKKDVICFPSRNGKGMCMG